MKDWYVVQTFFNSSENIRTFVIGAYHTEERAREILESLQLTRAQNTNEVFSLLKKV